MLTIPFPKFHENPPITLWVILFKNQQTIISKLDKWLWLYRSATCIRVLKLPRTSSRPRICHIASNWHRNFATCLTLIATMKTSSRYLLYHALLITSAEEGGYVFGSVCFSVCPSDYSQTCERILKKFFEGVGHGSRTKWYNFGGDPDHASTPGIQSPKSRSFGSAEVCALWVLLVCFSFCEHFHHCLFQPINWVIIGKIVFADHCQRA